MLGGIQPQNSFQKMNNSHLSLLSISDNSMETNYTDLTSPSSNKSISNNLDFTKQKQKTKKDSLDQIDFLKEFMHDPKYKTEMCKSFSEHGICSYGNKCRFAHGKHDQFDKVISSQKYKIKECTSYFNSGHCSYGSRCHFKHDERSIKEIKRSFYSYSLILKENLKISTDIMNMSEEEVRDLWNRNTFQKNKYPKHFPLFQDISKIYLPLMKLPFENNYYNYKNTQLF